MEKYATQEFGNPNSFHILGRNARRAIDQARETIAALLGASAKEIVFTSGGSESINLALRGAATANPQLGRGIVTLATEHEASRRACEVLKKQGYRTTYLLPDAHGRLTPEQVNNAVQDDTAIVSILHANNEIGTIQPLAEIVRAVRKKKPSVLIHADAVQSVGHIPVNVEELGVDLLSFTAHKFYGPKGIGGLYVRQGIHMEAEIVGGNQECGLRGGTESVPLIVGMAAALQAALSEMESERAHWRPFRDQVESSILALVRGSRSNGHPSERLDHFLSMSFLGVEGEDVVLSLDQLGICASAGSACNLARGATSHVLQAIGLSRSWSRGSLRLTFGHGCRLMDATWLARQVAAVVEELRSICPITPRLAREMNTQAV
jgi:cysteine desulfurase